MDPDNIYRDLLARHNRLTHRTDVLHHCSIESDTASYKENPFLYGASPQAGGSPSSLETPNEDVYDVAGLLKDSTPQNGPLNFEPSSASTIEATQSTSTVGALDIPAPQTNSFSDFDLFIDSINGSYYDGLSFLNIDQPIFPSSAPLFPNEISQPRASGSQPNRASTADPHLFDEFTSTLPSIELSQYQKIKEPWKITQQDWNHLLAQVQEFSTAIPEQFRLPSRHTMTRYITTYFAGFHRHLPFMHLPTFSGPECPVELILAMASIGAISAFDTSNAIGLFRTALGISTERLRMRKEQRRDMVFCTGKASVPDTLPGTRLSAETVHSQLSSPPSRYDPLPLAKTLLILMAIATWGNSHAIFNEGLEIQNMLINYIRSEELLDPQTPRGSTWAIWSEEEGFRRTIAIIFCFCIFHTIIYDTPPPILNSELKIRLPSREKDWAAASEKEWREARSQHEEEPEFQALFASLFSSSQIEPFPPTYSSSLGSYTTILALIQHIYFLRNLPNTKPEDQGQKVPILEALQNWQTVWTQDPESFLGPGSPHGPISFNSTALLRMAYIRLNVDVGPWRALTTHDPEEIALCMYRSPPLVIRDGRLTRAVLYSAHALSIPVKIGVNIVMQNQAFSWSLQHALCALECAFIISKWLVAIQPRVLQRTMDEDEKRVYEYIEDMVAEAEAGGEEMRSSSSLSCALCARVVGIWARIFGGKAHWNVVRLIGEVLQAYARILGQRSQSHSTA